MKHAALKLSALLGLTAAVGYWRHERSARRISNPRQHVADCIDEVLYLTSNPVRMKASDYDEDVTHAGATTELTWAQMAALGNAGFRDGSPFKRSRPAA